MSMSIGRMGGRSVDTAIDTTTDSPFRKEPLDLPCLHHARPIFDDQRGRPDNNTIGDKGFQGLCRHRAHFFHGRIDIVPFLLGHDRNFYTVNAVDVGYAETSAETETAGKMDNGTWAIEDAITSSRTEYAQEYHNTEKCSSGPMVTIRG